ncbi:MAG: putative DNA-binding domain-containing protein [Burkholderiales bacterium]|nr:putative DNA-binding domain-containing protein [Burkholderiales bacterium]
MTDPGHGSAGLREFQDGFAQALFGGGPDGALRPEIASLVAQSGFAVYRNTVMKGCIDALQANFPAVSRLVGDEWFRAAAAIFVRDNLPRRASLLDYGGEFPDFLGAFEPARALPYLVPVARVDRHWTQAHCAAEEPTLDAQLVAAVPPQELGRAVLTPHASARWAWHSEVPIRTIWERNRAAEAPAGVSTTDAPELDWRAEGVLLTRPGGSVEWIPVAAGECAFLDVCARGGTLAEAAQRALEAKVDVDLARLMARLLGAGAFTRLDLGS